MAGEFTQDGFPDVLLAFQDGTVQLQTNDSQGNFLGGAMQGAGLVAVETMVTADMTRDGRGNLVLASPTAGPLAVVTQSSPGMLVRTALVSSAATNGLAAADLDGDFNNEVVSSNTAGGRLQVMSVNDKGTVVTSAFEDAPAPGPMVAYALSGQVGRVLVGQRQSSSGVLVMNGFLGSAGRTVLSVSLPAIRQRRTGDFNRDGQEQMVILLDASPWLVLSSLSGVQTQVAVASNAAAMAAADMERDGMPDIVTVALSGSVELLYSLGTQAFTTLQVATVAPGGSAVELADLDGDLYQDILVLNPMGKTMTVFLRRCVP